MKPLRCSSRWQSATQSWCIVAGTACSDRGALYPCMHGVVYWLRHITPASRDHCKLE